MHHDIDQETAIACARMITDGGRMVDGRWMGSLGNLTRACADGGPYTMPPNTPQHDQCTGWIHPAGYSWACACPCHDRHRLSIEQARLVDGRRRSDECVGVLNHALRGHLRCPHRWSVLSVDLHSRAVTYQVRDGSGRRAATVAPVVGGPSSPVLWRATWWLSEQPIGEQLSTGPEQLIDRVNQILDGGQVVSGG